MDKEKIHSFFDSADKLEEKDKAVAKTCFGVPLESASKEQKDIFKGMYRSTYRADRLFFSLGVHLFSNNTDSHTSFRDAMQHMYQVSSDAAKRDIERFLCEGWKKSVTVRRLTRIIRLMNKNGIAFNAESMMCDLDEIDRNDYRAELASYIVIQEF